MKPRASIGVDVVSGFQGGAPLSEHPGVHFFFAGREIEHLAGNTENSANQNGRGRCGRCPCHGSNSARSSGVIRANSTSSETGTAATASARRNLRGGSVLVRRIVVSQVHDHKFRLLREQAEAAGGLALLVGVAGLRASMLAGFEVDQQRPRAATSCCSCSRSSFLCGFLKPSLSRSMRPATISMSASKKITLQGGQVSPRITTRISPQRQHCRQLRLANHSQRAPDCLRARGLRPGVSTSSKRRASPFLGA